MGWLNPQHLVNLANRVWAEREFILYNERRLTRRAVFANIDALAAGLQALGVQKGERVATLLPSCPEAVYATFLPRRLGCVLVPLNPLLREPELRHILTDCGARVVITVPRWYGQDYPALLTRLLPALPELGHVVVCDSHAAPNTDARRARKLAGTTEPFLSLAEVMSTAPPLQPARVSPDDLVLISYTSGTTGKPKGVAHTQRRVWGIAPRAMLRQLKLGSTRCLLLPLPLFHYAGLVGIAAALLAGGKVILMDHFDPQQMLETIQREKVTQLGASPTMYRLLLQTPGHERYDLSSVQRITFSTEPCPYDLAQALHERFRCSLENMYGTVESMHISWTGPDDSWERAATTVGKPVPGARVRMVDDARQPLPVREKGEIAVQTAQMMSGYYNDPALTAQVLDDTGWFYTGDIGYLGEDGYLRLVDRKKDLIIRGGQNVYPVEIEAHLQTHPAIRRAAVIGVPDAVSGEAVWAYIEPQPGATLTVAETLNFCRGLIAPFKVPERVRFLDHLPVTATGKVEKFRLREIAVKEHNATP